MALFKILRGPSGNLKDLPLKDGFCYFTPDTGLFYIDYEKDGVTERIPLNAAGSNTLAGANLVHDILNNRVDEIPSSALLSKEVDKINANKQDKITGDVGQIAGFDTNGDLIAIDSVGNAESAGGIIETNTGALIKLWYGTMAEYEAIGTKDNNTIYILSDDNNGEIVANEVVYDNGVSGLLATNVQAALDEIATTAGKAGYVLETNKGLQQKFWRGTQEEFDAIETKDEDTMYIIVGEDGENIIESSAQSDWNVNDPEEPAYIKNRPFYVTKQSTEIWDGNLDTALDSIIIESPDSGMNVGWVKISNEPVSFTSENYKFLLKSNYNGENQNVERAAYVWKTTDDYVSYHDGYGFAQMYSIIADSYNIEEAVNLTRGVWGQYQKEINTGNEMYYAGLLGGSEIKKIDSKFIPDTIARTIYVDSAIAAIPAPDMTQYYTKAEVDAAIEAAINKAFANIARAENTSF